MTGDKNHYDVIIAGAGLSGLMAGLILQTNGLKVLIVEKRPVAGGLCGTQIIDGYEFPVACNDFGSGFKRILEQAGLSYPFLKAHSIFCFEHNRYKVPADFVTLLKILPFAGDIRRMVSAMKNKRYAYLGELMKGEIKSENFRDTISMLAYALAMSPDDVRLDALREGFSKKYNYGYDRPLIPQGGPGALIEAIVQRFHEAGGFIRYEEEFTRVESAGTLENVHTSGGQYLCSFFISGQPRWGKYPADLKESLPIGMICLALKDSFSFPGKTTTIAWLPKEVAAWMAALDLGELPERFGFHITKSDLPPRPGHYTITISFLCPRGFENWHEEDADKAMKYILFQAGALLPGFESSVLYKKFISPAIFKELYGRTSQNFKYVLKEGVRKPGIYDREEDIYYIGNSVYPPGEHAGGAVLSAVYASEMILKR